MAEAGAAYAAIQAILNAHGRGAKANEDARFVLPNACETKIVVTMLKLLGQPGLSVWHRDCIMRELGRKTAVYRRGCLKNGLPEEAERIRVLVDAAQKTTPTTGCAAPGRAQAGPRAPGSRD